MLKILCALMLLCFLSALSFAELNTSQNFSSIYYHVDGNVDNSFYPQNDWDYQYQGSLSLTERYNDSEISAFFQYSASNDRLTDRRDFSLKKMSLNYKLDNSEFDFGDYGAYFSEYSVSNAIKGLHYQLGDQKESYFRLIAGVDTVYWEDFWEKRQEDSVIRRYITGLQVGTSFMEQKLKLKLNYGNALNDDAYLGTSAAQEFLNVFSLCSTLQLYEWLGFDFEWAKSVVELDKNRDDLKDISDNAIRFGVDFNTQYYSLSSVYSRVDYHFQNTSGFVGPDTESVSFDGIMFLPLNVQVNHYLRMNRDNLSKHQLTTSKQINPGLGLDFEIYNGYGLSLAYDVVKLDAVDKSYNERTDTYSLDISKDYNYVFVNAQYLRINVLDKVNGEEERNVDGFSLSLDGNFDLKETYITWNLAENITHEKYVEANKSDLLFLHSAGLNVQFPSSLYFDIKVNLADNDHYYNDYDNDIADYFLELGYFIKDSLKLSCAYEHRGYSYNDPDNNYSETKITGLLSYQF